MPAFYKKYLLPGFVFQSVVIGGGYGTGRELVEFFLTQGPAGGYFAMLLAAGIWGIVLAFGFELARAGRHYDYRTFLNALLGKGWIVFEFLYVVSVILTTAVVGSASGELLHEVLGSPRIVGTIIMVLLVAFLTYWGSGLIERVFSVWSLTLYGVYIILIVLAFGAFQETIIRNVTFWEEDSAWFLGGIKYAAYNLAALPAVLFAVRHIETRREAVGAGFLGGAIAMFPALLVYTAFLGHYPAIVEEAIPANFLLGSLGFPTFQLIFQFILFGTFIETGTGMIHGFNERIAAALRERGKLMSHQHRLVVAAVVLVVSIWLADRFGLIALVSQGYGLITWGFWIFFLIPILVAGSRKILPELFQNRTG